MSTNSRTSKLSPHKKQLLERWKQGDFSQITLKPNFPKQVYGNVAPMSFGQEQLWTLNQLQPDAVYNVFGSLRLQGKLNEKALTYGLEQLVVRHEALRIACGIDESGWPIQHIYSPLPIPLPLIDLAHLTPTQRLTKARQLIKAEVERPINLSVAPLWRTTLIRLDNDDHIFLLVLHHIIADGWSLNVLFKELLVLYAKYDANDLVSLPELPLQYADYAIWQKGWLQGGVFEDHVGYWKKHLVNAPKLLELPIDHRRPSIQHFRGHTLSFTIPSDLVKALRLLAQQENVTLFMLVLAAYAILLMRYSGQKDIVIGTPVAGRTHSQWEEVVGYFVNMLALRFHLQEFPTVQEVIQYTREMFLEGLSHQDFPFEKLVEVLQPQRDLAHSPVFQVTFALQNLSGDQTQNLAGLTVTPFEIEITNSAKFDLSLFLYEFSTTIRGEVEFNTELFNSNTIERLIQHYLVVLERMVVNCDVCIWHLQLLTESEKEIILHTWNNTTVNYPQENFVHQIFEKQVTTTPEAIAILFQGQELTYEQLNQRANQVAHYLLRIGIEPEVPIGVYMPRSFDTVVAVLGILKAGGCYLPLDREYPQERITFILQDAGVTTILTQQKQLDGVPGCVKNVVCLDVAWEHIDKELETNPDRSLYLDNLAYVIYTSGSTGTPKGTMISHRSLLNYVSWCLRMYPVLEGEGSPVHSSIGFDLTVTSFFLPLLVGRKIIIVPESDGIEGLKGVLQANRNLSFIKITPSHLEVLAHTLSNEHAASMLKALVIGGEALTEQNLSFWQTYAPDTKLFNEYGPTEATVGCCVYQVSTDETKTLSVPIGRPIANTKLYILDTYMQPVPVGITGELYIGGAGLARGYLTRPGLTAKAFLPDPFSREPGSRLYRTGDLARYLPDGQIEFLGRKDYQVKIRGYRVELNEIEAVLSQHPAVHETVVATAEDISGDKRLVAYIVARDGKTAEESTLRRFLKEKLPDYMLPATFIFLSVLPLNINGKVDRQALPSTEGIRPSLEQAYVVPRHKTEQVIAKIWQDVLGSDQVGIHDNFFDLGGHSLLVIRVWNQLKTLFDQDIPLTHLFRYPTIAAQAQYFSDNQLYSDPIQEVARERANSRRALWHRETNVKPSHQVAIIGMAGRFPGADDLHQFWNNLRNGVEGITFFSDGELVEAGENPELLRRPNYVKANGSISNIEYFDASFFNFSAAEAEIMDPQHRIFLMSVWQAIENAGYDIGHYEQRIGVYAGASPNTYLLHNLYSQPGYIGAVGAYRTVIGNGNDFLATQVSYRLNLRGPSVSVQTACSTSLVAVHLAYQGLVNRECDMALAGGVSLTVPQTSGYLYVEGHIESPDGHCRPFDINAKGTVSGSGVGVVVLKRLDDALQDGDTIYAVIKGSAMNNDGARKVGYTAPSEDGQTEVITEALVMADVHPETITYVEAHGTATLLGDPIEFAALKRAFATGTDAKRYCGLGSVKSNIGHLDVAAGIAGLIKTVLALKHKELVPSLHFTKPNPKLDLDNSPFYVNTKLQEWQVNGHPRRAGVSSFGVGGTNVHVILEEMALDVSADPGRKDQLFILSAKSEKALEAATINLAAYLRQYPSINPADVAYTLQIGRSPFSYRRILACNNVASAAAALEQIDPKQIFTAFVKPQPRTLFFMFPGQGTQHVNMGRELYETVPVFRAAVNHCAALLEPHLGLNLIEVLYPKPEHEIAATEYLNQTAVTQPALFVIEYALAQVWLLFGLQPQAMLGHSLGEYTAACLAGVFAIEDVLAILVQRGRLIQQLPAGSMLGVSLSETEILSFLTPQVALAAINGPKLCTLSGPEVAVKDLQNRLETQGISCHHLHTSHAFHSAMMEPIMAEFASFVAQMPRKPPVIPFISNLTGTWITAKEATDPYYWAKHLRQTVQFARGLQTLLGVEPQVLLEVGPGHTLCNIARYQQVQAVLPSLPRLQDEQGDYTFWLTTLGRLWLNGLEINWQKLYGTEKRQRIPLPTYPFSQERYWVEPHRKSSPIPGDTPFKNSNIAEWFYIPYWKRTMPPQGKFEPLGKPWLIFSAGDELSIQIAQTLQAHGQDITIVLAGETLEMGFNTHTIRPSQQEDYETLLTMLRVCNQLPAHIIHLWNVGHSSTEAVYNDEIDTQCSFNGLLYLAQAMSAQNLHDPVGWTVISSNMQQVIAGEYIEPQKALLLGFCRVIPQEMPNIFIRSIDVVQPEASSKQIVQLTEQILAEITAKRVDPIIAYRGHERLVLSYEPVSLPDLPEGQNGGLRTNGTYLITHGFGRMGMALAKYLAQTVNARLVLFSPLHFPPRETWEEWLNTPARPDIITSHIQTVKELESSGVEVVVMQVDIADWSTTAVAIRSVYERFGAIHGVIHAVDPLETDRSLPEREKAATGVTRPEVRGTQVLISVLQEIPVDFIILCSSLSSVVGGVGLVAESATGAFMDAFATAQKKDNKTVVMSIAWDVWEESTTAVHRNSNHEIASSPISVTNRPDLNQAILFEEGIEAFRRILAHNTLPQIIVSPRHLPTLIHYSQEIRTGQLTKQDNQPEESRGRYLRPNLQTPYVAPRNQIEQELADYWQQALGFSEIGIYDNFFELGGHSLLATQLVAVLRDAFELELSIREFLEFPTVAELAELIVGKQLGGANTMPEWEGLLSEIENLSDDELQRLLAEEE